MLEEHQWQLSAYWHALVEAGFPMLDTFAILYLPMNNVMQEADPEPVVIEAKPIPAEDVYAQMESRYALTQEYASTVPNWPEWPGYIGNYLTKQPRAGGNADSKRSETEDEMILAWDAIFRYEGGTVYCSGAFTAFLILLIVALALRWWD